MVADDPGLIDLETTILLLPRVSRSAHLGGPLLHAQHLIDLWSDTDADTIVPLASAFRLLDAEAIVGAITRAAATDDYSSHPSYWDLPGAEILLSELRALVWRAMLEGTLQVEAIKGLRGKRHHTVLPAELPRLAPDWALSRLMLDGRDEFIDVRVRRVPAQPIKPTWRDKPSAANLQSFLIDEIEPSYPDARDRPETRPTFEELQTKANEHFKMEVPRDDLRAALDAVPHLKRERGQKLRS